MAIPRMLNSNTPFIQVKGGSVLSLLKEEKGIEGEEKRKDPLIQTIVSPLRLAMEQGTAKQVGPGGHDAADQLPYVSIIAQAEGDSSQEFSPTSTECTYSRSHLLKRHRSTAKQVASETDTEEEEYVGIRKIPHHCFQRKHRRKPLERRRRRQEGEEPPVIQGLWVQEIDWSKSVDDEVAQAYDMIPLPVDHPQVNHHSHGGCSLEGVSEPCILGDVSGSCCSFAGVSEYLEDTSLSDNYNRLMGLSDSFSELGEESDYSCHLDGVYESLCIHKGETNSLCSFGGASDSLCSLEGVSDCFSSVMCVSDNFLVRGSVSESSCSLMAVSDSESACCLGRESGSSSSMEGVSNSLCSLAGVSDCTHSLVEDSKSTCSQGSVYSIEELRGTVTKRNHHFVSPFFKEVVKDTSNEKEVNAHTNEGLIFHKLLQPSQFGYREGKEYNIIYHIQNGSYGDVFSVQDKSTGFECAAKRIPLSHFNCEEVSTWSALNSPRVVELFGAVREGLNLTLFMDQKTGCLAQLLRERGSLPEDLALHYLWQLLGALEHLHQRHVLHLDIKVDNVLLSEDGMDTFLCDFGLSETLDHNGQSTKAYRGSGFPGTETHMAPEVARGDLRCAKADVWSSCCMLLHMLNGCHPWIRYYSHPLCLKIVNEPPPLWEVPPWSNHFTAEVFRAGLQKDPIRRASATELRKKTTKALRAVGGLSRSSVIGACEKLVNNDARNGDTLCTRSPRIPSAPAKPTVTHSAPTLHWVSPWRARAIEEDNSDSEEDESESEKNSELETDSLDARDLESQQNFLEVSHLAGDKDLESEADSEVDIYLGEEEDSEERRAWEKSDWDYEGDWEEEESEWESYSSTELFHALQVHFPVLRTCQHGSGYSWGSESELEYLRDGMTVGSLAPTLSPEPRDDPPSCLSSTDTSQIDPTDKDSDHWSDDLSSGVFSSYNSQTDGQSFNLEWLVSTNQPPSYCFEGVDIWIENIGGECLRIRDRRQVKVGHVAIGISEQISAKAFSLETLDRKLVSFQQEIEESGLWLRCIPAPDGCPRWSWRIREGKLEIRE